MEREWIDEVIKSDFVDTWRELNPDLVDRYSYWDVKTRSRERNVGWRIDYFFIDRSLLPSLRNASIHEDLYGSDHCPISIDINI